MKEKIGFVGLGIMGRPMALNIHNAGYPLSVHARREECMQPLSEVGAKAAKTCREVAEASDIIFVMVSDTPDVEQVILGDHGVIHGARPGSIVVDMSTISPRVTRNIAEALAKNKVMMLDAPVSGGEVGAINAGLSIMVGGSAVAFERVRSLFQCMGKNIVHVGENGAGQVAKACNQIVVAVTIQAVSEAILFARKNGVDAARVRDALMGGFAGSKILEVHGKRMLDDDYKPGFKVKLHQKDMNIVMEAARQMGFALPASALVAQNLNALMGTGDAELDSAAIYKIVEKMSA